MPYEPANSQLRASDADREAAVERLRVAAMEGRLDADELEARLDAAYAARWCHQLEPLTLDVTPAAPPTPAVRPVFVRPATKLNGLAIASLCLGIVWLGWVGSIAAVVLGHVALGQITRSGGRQTGRGAAIAGLCLGYLGMLTLALTVLGTAVG